MQNMESFALCYRMMDVVVADRMMLLAFVVVLAENNLVAHSDMSAACDS